MSSLALEALSKTLFCLELYLLRTLLESLSVTIHKDALILYYLANGVNIDFAKQIWDNPFSRLQKKLKEKKDQPKGSPFTAHMLDICDANGTTELKTPKTTLQTGKLGRGGKKPRAKSRHKKTIPMMMNNPLSKLEATKGPASSQRPNFSRGTSEVRVDPQLTSVESTSQKELVFFASTIVHYKSASGHDASVDFTAGADSEKSDPMDSFPPKQGTDEGTKNYSFDHFIAGANPSVLVDKTQSARDGLGSVQPKPETEKEEFHSSILALTKKVATLEDYWRDISARLLAFPEQVSSINALLTKINVLDALPSLLNKVVAVVYRFAIAVAIESTSQKTGDHSVPLAGQADTYPVEGEKNTGHATITQIFQRTKQKDVANANLNKQPTILETTTIPETTTSIPLSTITTTLIIPIPLSFQSPFLTRVTRPKIEDKDNFELKGQFLKELRTNTFNGSNHEDANEHIKKVLEIVDLFHIHNITIDQVMLRAFPMFLTRSASRWLKNKPSGSITTWEDLKTKFLRKYCPLARTAKNMEEINNFQQETDKNLYHTWERFKELLMKCPQHYLTEMQETVADAKVAIQEMAKYSQKWHNGTSRTKSTETSNGLAAIQAQLNNLEREIKNVNEKVYDAQVGCEQCKGIHYTKDCLLKEEGKTLEEAYYTQFAITRKENDLGSFTLLYYNNNVCFDNALADLGASISVMPLSTYLNLGLDELAHIKLIVKLADRTVKYPKGIAKNVLVGIGKTNFLVDFIILDMPEDIKVPLILERPFWSITHAKIDVFKREITLRVGEEKTIFKKARLIGETLVLNRSLDPLFGDYIELNDLNVLLELRRDQVDDLIPIIEEGGAVEKFRARNDARMVSKIFGYPSDYDHDKKIRIDCAHNLKFSCMIDFAVLEDMDAYRDEGIGDVIFGEPFLEKLGLMQDGLRECLPFTMVRKKLLTKCVTPPDGAWTEYVSEGVTLLRISSTKHKERPLRYSRKDEGTSFAFDLHAPRGISILLAVGTPSTGSGKLYCQWELSSSSGNSLCILFPTVKDKQEKDEIGSKPDKNGRRSVKDKILIPKLPENCARCAKCGHPVNGHYCQGCALAREKLEEDLVTYFQNFQNISESSDDSTNVVNAPREPIVVKTDHGVNPLHIDKCCCECGDALDGIFCQ
nr:hypothetical protein [Tanacetum cinerariifolium]